MTVIRSFPQKGIDYQLSFNDGRYKCEAFIHYDQKENDTVVTWEMKGDMAAPVVGGYLALTVDSMAGPMFERGLSKLKKIVEEK